MEDENTTFISTSCPYCGHFVDAHTRTDKKPGGPETGSLSLCFYCGRMSMYDEHLLLRELTQEEHLEVYSDPGIIRLLKLYSILMQKRKLENDRSGV